MQSLIVQKAQCRYYNRGSCKYGNKCWFMHDDLLRTKFQNEREVHRLKARSLGYEEYNKYFEEQERERKIKLEENERELKIKLEGHKRQRDIKLRECEIKKRELEEREEYERDYKTGEWNVIFTFNRKKTKHKGYCSAPDTIVTDSDYDSDSDSSRVVMDVVPNYVKSEHVKDFIVVDEDIIDKLCYECEMYNECCGYRYSDMRIEIRPTIHRVKRLLMTTKLNVNIIGLILNRTEQNNKEDVGFW